jgi:hypothetical protein
VIGALLLRPLKNVFKKPVSPGNLSEVREVFILLLSYLAPRETSGCNGLGTILFLNMLFLVIIGSLLSPGKFILSSCVLLASRS